jgi:hypothetical protein
MSLHWLRDALALRGIWPLNLALAASLGPLVIFSVNLNRIMLETVASGVLILFVALVVLRTILAIALRRPAWTDPLIVLVFLGGFYNCLFASDPRTLLFWLWLAVFALGAVLVFTSTRVRAILPTALCIFLGILNVLVVASIFQNVDTKSRSDLRAALQDHYPALDMVGDVAPERRPNIFYLVFDRYARADQLDETYAVDNSGFLTNLRERGFQVSANAYSAYQRTAHSLASTLNLDYLPEAGDITSNDWVPLYESLRAPRLYDVLHSEDYRIINMGSWWEPTRTSTSADVNLSYLTVPESLRPFVEDSAVVRGLDGLGLDWFDPRRRQCARIRHKFATLADLDLQRQPVFVFAHFLVPHPPYVIDANGSCISAEYARDHSRRDNYVAQLRYTNAAILDLVDTLIARDPQAVIVLQSDEGPWPERYAGEEITRFGADISSVDWTTVSPGDLRLKMAILNAIRLPGKPDVRIGDDFSPINTFRVVLRSYFGLALDDLEARNWVFLSDASLWSYLDVRQDLLGAPSGD